MKIPDLRTEPISLTSRIANNVKSIGTDNTATGTSPRVEHGGGSGA